MNITKHPFIATPDGGCSSCGKGRNDRIHDFSEYQFAKHVNLITPMPTKPEPELNPLEQLADDIIALYASWSNRSIIRHEVQRLELIDLLTRTTPPPIVKEWTAEEIRTILVTENNCGHIMYPDYQRLANRINERNKGSV